MAKKLLYCSNCHENKDENEFTKFSRNPSLKDRNGRVIYCRDCCNKEVEENGNTIEALKNVLRKLDIPFIQNMANLAVDMLNKKREETNEVIKKNVYDGTVENVGIETNNIQTTLYTCYAGRIGLIPKKYINFSYSDGIREDDGSDNKEPVEEDKERDSSIKFLKKMFSEAIYNDQQRLAKAVQLKFEELSLHKNNTNARQSKFKLKNSINYLIDIEELDKNYFGFMVGDTDEDVGIEDEVEKVENEVVTTPIPEDINYDILREKWGDGFSKQDLVRFETKYKELRKNYEIKTTAHDEFLRHACIASVRANECMAKKDTDGAKAWFGIFKDMTSAGKLQPSQMSKADLSGGLNSFSEFWKTVEQARNVIDILPQMYESPRDKADLVIYCLVQYVRRLKGLPDVEYKDIYKFYEEMESQFIDDDADIDIASFFANEYDDEEVDEDDEE
jgi:hypothetical protein